MAEKINTLAAAKASLQMHLAACAGWAAFVDTVLKAKRELESTLLGGIRPIRTEIPGGGEFGPSEGSGRGSGYVDVTGMYDEEDDEGSNSDEDDDSGEDEDEIDDDDLDLGDDADMDSDQDPLDYEGDKCEVREVAEAFEKGR